jgi:phosphoglycolate phosphatase-like HAD superfamily hydrolase
MPGLAVFDIDGTLTDTNAVDDECFLRAAAEVFEVDVARLDWSGAPHVTDSAIARWLCTAHKARLPTDSELARMTERFVGFLRDELAQAAERFAPVPGVRDLFADLRAVGWEVALATGGWDPSARLKLAGAGLDDAPLVLASSSDAATRTEILELALHRAREHVGADFARVVSVGDAAWDVRAAAELGWPFVGIARGSRARALCAAGAAVVLSDFSNRVAVYEALEAATVPPTRGRAFPSRGRGRRGRHGRARAAPREGRGTPPTARP